MKIAIFSQEINHDVKNVLKSILIHKDAQNCNFFVHKNLSQCKINANNFSFFKNYDDLDKSFDLFISIGGDGTFLRSIEFVRNLNLPIIGVNTGRLGFLASTKKENLEKSLTKIFKKKFNVEKRSILKVSSENKCIPVNSFPYALNEISVVRKDTTSMINVKTSLDGTYVNSYWSDGLIVSTPTGSTGYSLSCGGPVISPSSNSFVLTPISPHNLNARPLVISDSTKIEISVSGREEFHLLSIDAKIFTIKNETKIFVEKSNFDIQVASINNYNFYKTLKDKLLWGKDKRN
ncbi:MAG: NAD kinase [Flavobacteriaceae bacterium]|nr:NAD kinase [Flavobacteriaceae bacterium]MBL6684360.1 NAD kinase [Flavobacteriaceae bacterium]